MDEYLNNFAAEAPALKKVQQTAKSKGESALSECHQRRNQALPQAAAYAGLTGLSPIVRCWQAA
jgi:hypothetical protein